jgi:HK97 gp10 family phage protein
MAVKGLDSLLRKLRSLSKLEADKAIGEALFAAGNLIEVEAAISITTGAVSGRNHVPSNPGEPPNEDTGMLSRGIQTIQVSPTEVRVVSDAPYSAALEFGTSRMEARPFMGPAVRAKRKDARDLIRRRVKAGIRRAMQGRG